MKKIVLHILNTGSFSGAENVVITMINGFRKYDPQQYKFVYVSLEGSIRERLKQEHIKYEAIEKVSRREIQRVIHKYHPSIIHAHDFTASIICASVAGKIPVISHIHNNSPWLRKVCINSIGYGVSCFKYKYMLGVSDSVFDEFIFGKVFKKKERIIGNPISITSVQEKAQIAECKDSYDMVFLGRLSEPKNPEAFVEIVKEVKKQLPVHAVMIGDGELKEKVASKIKKNGLQEVIELKGFLENPYGILGNSKVLCMPSRWEGFGLAAVEALALGKPVIATGVGGLPGFIDESCGKICSSKDEFIQESYYLLKDINYYQKKSQGAVFRANKLDNISKYIRNIEVIYERS